MELAVGSGSGLQLDERYTRGRLLVGLEVWLQVGWEVTLKVGLKVALKVGFEIGLEGG